MRSPRTLISNGNGEDLVFSVHTEGNLAGERSPGVCHASDTICVLQVELLNDRVLNRSALENAYQKLAGTSEAEQIADSAWATTVEGTHGSYGVSERRGRFIARGH